MKKNVRIGSAILGTLMLVSLFAAFVPRTPSVAGGPGSRSLVSTVTSALVTTAPTLDGQGTDTVWNQASGITITVSGGANTVGNVDVHLKSVYIGSRVYFYANWSDPQDSKDRFPWFYNTTSGKWEQHGNTTSGDEDNYYEDKLAMIWNIGNSIPGFGGATGSGPAVTCHPPKHRTNGPAQFGDLWHWKRVRTGPVGQMDDQYMDDNQTAPEGGRHSDPNTGGGYSDNKNTSLQYIGELPGNVTTGPSAWYPTAVLGDDGYYWIKKSDIDATAYKFTGVYRSNGTLMDDHGNFANESSHIPGIQISPVTGDRGNISAGAAWSGGFWTLEFGRNLVTGSQYDVQFNDTGPTAVYYFGLAIYNNAQIDHNIGFGDVYALDFQQPNGPPSNPVATFTPASPKAGDTVTFAVVSVDPDGDTLTYSWQFGDGASGTGIAPTHVYGSSGAFTATVTVDDGHSHTKTATVTVTVAEKAAGLSTTMLVIIIVVILLIVVVIAIALRRRRKSAPPMEPQQPQP